VRQAPPIALTLSGAGAWRVAQVALPTLSAAVVAVWLVAWTPLLAGPLWSSAVAASASMLVAVAAWFGSAPKSVHLIWTGEHWAADGSPGEVDLMLDLGPWLLLRFRPPAGRSRWLPVPRREAGAAEQGLRAALYARGAAVERRQA
jgi:hypothetical protein